MWVKQSTAATLIVGPILDSTGAEYTSAVIGDLSISKNGGTLTALAAAATLTHIANGQYTLVMTTGNLDTLGRLQITCNKSTYQMPPIGLNIVPAMVFDSLVLGSDRFDANVTHVGDTSQTAGDIYASQVTIAGYIDTEVSAIKAKTDNLPSDPADQSAVEAAITAATSPLATQASVNTIDDFLDTEIAAIKTKTDQLTFTTANKVDSTAVLDSAATAAVADAVLRESILDHRNVAHSLAKFIWQIRQANLTIDGTVSNAITPTTLTFASNVVATTSAYAHAVLLFTTGPLEGENSPIISYNSTNGVFVLEEPLTAAPSNGDEFVVIAGSHVHSVADIQSGLATAAALAAAKTILDKVDTGLVVDGAVYQFTANMLELGPAGGAATVAVLPATGIVADRSAGTTLNPVVGETISQSITVYQSDGTTAVSLSGKTLKVIFETMSGVDVAVVLAADITISGASSNVVTFAYPAAVTASERTLRFAIRDAAAPLTMYLQGVCSVVAAPKVDA